MHGRGRDPGAPSQARGGTNEAARLEEQAIVLTRALAAEGPEFTSESDQDMAAAINEAAAEASALHHEMKTSIRAKLAAERAEDTAADQRFQAVWAAFDVPVVSAEKKEEKDIKYMQAAQANVSETAQEAEQEAAALKMEARRSPSKPFLPGRAIA